MYVRVVYTGHFYGMEAVFHSIVSTVYMMLNHSEENCIGNCWSKKLLHEEIGHVTFLWNVTIYLLIFVFWADFFYN